LFYLERKPSRRACMSTSAELLVTRATRSIARYATATWLAGWLTQPVLCLNG